MVTPGDNHGEVTSYEAQAREFLDRGRNFLAAGDLHQASEKGWGAAAHMAKAVAIAQGWRYARHSHYHRVMNQAGRLTGNTRLPFLHGRAEVLHANYYELKEDLDAALIRKDLDGVAELLEILRPLTGLAH
jgi:hypothetical protein